MEHELKDPFGKKYDRLLIWYITKTCNFNCPQCAGEADKLTGDFAPETIDITSLDRMFHRTDKTFRVNFTGGEPFLVANIVEAIQKITQKHYISLISNLVSPLVKKFAEKIDPDRVTFINASAHMMELKKRNQLDTFISNCLLLKEKGFQLCISEVAYPFITDKVEEYCAYFKKYGLDIDFMAFRGHWKGLNYPDAYTDQEIENFNLKKFMHTRHDIFHRKGKPCHAGYNLAVVMNNGNVQPCFSVIRKMGNIFSGIEFQPYLIKCPFEYCPCPFPTFENYLYEKALHETKTIKLKEKNIDIYSKLYRRYASMKIRMKQLFKLS